MVDPFVLSSLSIPGKKDNILKMNLDATQLSLPFESKIYLSLNQ